MYAFPRLIYRRIVLTRSVGHRASAAVITMASTQVTRQPLAAVCQMNCTADKRENMKNAARLIKQAAVEGALMAFLPEACDYIATSKEESFTLSEELENGETIEQFRQLAVETKMWLSLGGFHQRYVEGKSKNSHVIIDDEGQITAVYDKVHLFDIDLKEGEKIRLKESDYTAPGTRLVAPVKTPIGKVGLSICYDLRFPEASLSLTEAGADILTYPSAFTVATGRAHWEILLRNKAIENQCYVIAAAQTGKHNEKRASYGHAMIVNPWGEIVASCGDDVGLAIAHIDLDFLAKVRSQIPLRAHRRRDLYATVAPDLTLVSFNIDNDEDFIFGTLTVKGSQIFYKTAVTVGFVNKKPVLPGHVLVAPTRPGVKRLGDLNAHEIFDLFGSVQRIQRVVEEVHGSMSSTIAIQDGPEAGQTVDHFHIHILPRKKGDFANNDDIYDKLEKHDRLDNPDSQKGIQSEDDMKAAAQILRQKMSRYH